MVSKLVTLLVILFITSYTLIINKIKDDFMSTLVFDNGYETFEDFQDDMLNMTAANIFGE